MNRRSCLAFVLSLVLAAISGCGDEQPAPVLLAPPVPGAMPGAAPALPTPAPHATYRGDFQRRGVYAAPGVPQLTGVKWKLKTNGEVNTPAVFGGRVFVGSGDRFLYALDLVSGQQLWKAETGAGPAGMGVWSPPTVTGDTVYFWGLDHGLRAHDVATGAERWNNKAGATVGWLSASPLIAGGKVVSPVGNPFLQAFDPNNGARGWSFQGRQQLIGSPTLAGDRILIGDMSGALNAVPVTDLPGKPRGASWKFKAAGQIGSTAAVEGNTAYFTGFDHGIGGPRGGAAHVLLYAVDAASGAELWRFTAAPHAAGNTIITSSPAVAGGVVYFGGHDGQLYAVDAASGQQRWAVKIGTKVLSAPSVASGVVYVGTEDGNLHAIWAATGQELWRFATKGPIDSSPVIEGTTVLVGSDDKHLYALH